MKLSKWGLRLNYDVTTSDRSAPTPKFLKIDPRLRGVSQYVWTHMLINSMSRCLNTLHACHMDVEYTPWGFEPPSWHYIITQAHVYPQIPNINIQPQSAALV